MRAMPHALKPDSSSVIRIAIAFAALKHKSRGQSIASYILDLQSHFPLVCIGTEEESRSLEAGAELSIVVSERATEKWRAHALELEKQLEGLKAQRDAEQEDWCAFLHSQHPPHASLVDAYTSLKGALSSYGGDKCAYASRLTDAITRAFEVLHAFLFSNQRAAPSPVLPGPPTQTRRGNPDTPHISMASPLLMYILQTALPMLLRTHENPKRSGHQARAESDTHANIDKAINHLIDCVLLPSLRSFVPLCNTRLAPLLATKKVGVRDKGKGKEFDKAKTSNFSPLQLTDTRTDILTLLGMSLAALDALPPHPYSNGCIATGVKEHLGLETIRELEALYTLSPQPKSQTLLRPEGRSSEAASTESEKRAQRLQNLAGTREDRIRALAVKDAAWYLCSVVNLCIPQTGAMEAANGKVMSESSVLLVKALVDGVGRLLRMAANVGNDVGQGEGGGRDGNGVVEQGKKTYAVDARIYSDLAKLRASQVH
ncbi:hypothetical protein HYDPIDRAFT_42793 [Hydnomerulius pinastri MD-312]|uniref:Uncharacterized protein n=1 Tax=Hydnomerulius pinastri MD-312 TaxID=994086 RepID=A0A0C9V6J9_9AGAM|nr:hypothetical protein HYDPIDRAFT_42793 [Hydnomerulius pinastri MD-312]